MQVVAETRQEPAVIRLSGPLTIGTIQQLRDVVLAAMDGAAPMTLDCSEGTAFDVAFLQLLESARLLATRQETTLRLAQPLPPRLAEILAEGGFRDWAMQERSAA
ncbi:STAS domain-containing protein [Roseomonas sp. F4]